MGIVIKEGGWLGGCMGVVCCCLLLSFNCSGLANVAQVWILIVPYFRLSNWNVPLFGRAVVMGRLSDPVSLICTRGGQRPPNMMHSRCTASILVWVHRGHLYDSILSLSLDQLFDLNSRAGERECERIGSDFCDP